MLKTVKATVASAAAFIIAGTAASAGGLADEIMEAPVVVEAPVEAAASGSVPSWVIPVAILAIILGIASTAEDDDPIKKIPG